MSACEKCWSDAYTRMLTGQFESQAHAYQELVHARQCTPEEQAGPHATECTACERQTRHEVTGECMACGAQREATWPRGGA